MAAASGPPPGGRYPAQLAEAAGLIAERVNGAAVPAADAPAADAPAADAPAGEAPARRASLAAGLPEPQRAALAALAWP